MQCLDISTTVARGRSYTAGVSGLAVLSIEIISTSILAPRDDTMYSKQTAEKKYLPFSHGKLGAHFPLGRVELQLLTRTQLLLHCCISTGHVQPFLTLKGICFSRKKTSIASAVRVSYARVLLVYLGINASIKSRTYHAFDKLKVIVVGNGHDVLGC